MLMSCWVPVVPVLEGSLLLTGLVPSHVVLLISLPEGLPSCWCDTWCHLCMGLHARIMVPGSLPSCLGKLQLLRETAGREGKFWNYALPHRRGIRGGDIVWARIIIIILKMKCFCYFTFFFFSRVCVLMFASWSGIDVKRSRGRLVGGLQSCMPPQLL